MTLLYDNETQETFDFDEVKIAEAVMRQSLMQEGFTDESEVSLTITDDEEIARLNADFRQIDKPTDVLSFPMLDFGGIPAADYTVSEAEKNPDTGEVMLGDIVISYPRAAAQAKEYGHALLREYAFLIAHSMLHLLGYDHMTDEERTVMEDKQEQILTALDIKR